MLPEDSELGRLRVDAVLDEVDGPRLLSIRNASGRAFLAIWVRNIKTEELWLYAPISDDRMCDVVHGDLEISLPFLDPEDGFIYRVLGSSVSRISAEDVSADDLPPDDDFLEYVPHEEESSDRVQIAATPSRRQIRQRIYIAQPSHANSFVSERSVATLLSKWHDSEDATAVEHGSNRTSWRPEIQYAATGSFELASVWKSRSEPRIRALQDWSFLVTAASREEDLERALSKTSIDVETCLNFVSSLARSGLRFQMTLVGKDDTTIVGFDLSSDVASTILRGLSEAPLRLPSRYIPQADTLNTVCTLLEYDWLGGEIPKVVDEMEPRQHLYYRHAAQLLSLSTKSGAVTAQGRAVVRATDEERRRLLRIAFACSRAGWAWSVWAGKPLECVDPKSAERFLVENSRLSKSTAERRARTLRVWHESLFDAPSTEPDAERELAEQ